MNSQSILVVRLQVWIGACARNHAGQTRHERKITTNQNRGE